MSTKPRISATQVFVLVCITSFCVTPFGFGSLFSDLGRHIWVASFVQAGVVFIGATGVLLLLQRHPNTSLPVITGRLLGRPLARVYLVGLGIFAFLWGFDDHLVQLRLVESATLEITAPLIFSLVMILTAVYAAHFGPEIIGRTTEVWSIVILPLLFVFGVAPWLSGTPGRLLPLGGIPLESFSKMNFWAFALGLRGFTVILILAGMLPPAPQLRRALYGGVMLSSVLLTLLVLAPYTLYAPETARYFQFQVIEAMDAVSVNQLGFQSLLSLILTVWHAVSWVVISATIYLSSYVLANAVGLASHKPLVWVIGAVHVLFVGHPRWREYQPLLSQLWSSLGYVVAVGVPWLMFLLSKLKSPNVEARV